MLKEALSVIEAARSLGLVFDGGRTRSTLDILDLALNLDGLRLAIEVFDKATEHGRGNPGDINKPDFATPPQLDDVGFDVPDVNLTPQFLPGELGDEMVDRFKPDLTVEEKEENLKDLKAQLARESSRDAEAVSTPTVPAPVLSARRRVARFGAEADYSDMMETLQFSDEDSVTEFLTAIDRLEDKIGYISNKRGSNPRLAKLAQVFIEMRKRLNMEIKEEQGFVILPTQVFGKLSLAIAGAVMDRDQQVVVPELKITAAKLKDDKYELPVPRPKYLG